MPRTGFTRFAYTKKRYVNLSFFARIEMDKYRPCKRILMQTFFNHETESIVKMLNSKQLFVLLVLIGCCCFVFGDIDGNFFFNNELKYCRIFAVRDCFKKITQNICHCIFILFYIFHRWIAAWIRASICSGSGCQFTTSSSFERLQ